MPTSRNVPSLRASFSTAMWPCDTPPCDKSSRRKRVAGLALKSARIAAAPDETCPKRRPCTRQRPSRTES
jgi:hypothetical protein